MKTTVTVLAILLAILIGGGVYWGTAFYAPLAERSKDDRVKIENLERKVNDLNQELNLKVIEISRTQQEKEMEIARIQLAKDSLMLSLSEQVKQKQIEITQMADKLKVSIGDQILFPSGQTEISSGGLKILENIGRILSNVEKKNIRVEGHTDNVPIHDHLKNRFPTNWELSTARATNVIRFLQEKVGISPERLEAVGKGEFSPIASNSTREGREKNRRIEIYLFSE